MTTTKRTRKGVDDNNLNVVAQGNVTMMTNARQPLGCRQCATIKALVLIAFVAIIGFSFISCEEPEPKDALDLTRWEKVIGEQKYFLSFSSPNVTHGITGQYGSSASGTYTLSDNDTKVTLTFDQGQTTGTISGKTMTFTSLVMDGGSGVFTRVK